MGGLETWIDYIHDMLHISDDSGDTIRILYHDDIDNPMNSALREYILDTENEIDGIKIAAHYFSGSDSYNVIKSKMKEIEKELGGKPDIVLNFKASPNTYVLKKYKEKGALVLNDPDVYSITGNKMRTYRILEDAGIDIPATALPGDKDEVKMFVENHEGPYILKPTHGHGGKGIRRMDTMEEILENISYGSDMLQEDIFKYWPHESYRDIRAYVVGDRCISAMYRVNDKWITNLHRGGHGEALPEHIFEKIGPLAVRAARAIAPSDKLSFCGVDILEKYDENGCVDYVVLEINSAPGGFYNLEKATGEGRNTVRSIIEYAMEVYRDVQ